MPLDRLVRHTRPEGDCLLWTGYCNPVSGYGQISLRVGEVEALDLPRICTVHRLSARLTFGPSDQHVLHDDTKCQHRNCWNPDHLRYGTPKENNHDSWTTGHQRWAETHPHAKYPNATITELRQRVAAGESGYAVALDLGLDVSYTYKILRGEARPHG